MDEKNGIVYKQWNAASAQAVLLLVHGLGGHSDRWGFLAQFLLQNRISSYAIELKGFGQTRDLKGHIDSFQTYFTDILCLRAIIQKEHPQAKVFILGESLGGLLVFLLAIRDPGLFNGLICISPAFKNKMQFSHFEIIKILASFFFNPQQQFHVPFNAQMCTRDTGYQMTMERDDKEHRLASAKMLVNIVIAELRAAFLKERLTTPTLFLIAGRDFLVDARASLNIFKKLKIPDKTIMQYPEMYHALSIDLGREKVFADILKWMQERLR